MSEQVSRVVKIANAHREVDVLTDKVDPPVCETHVEMQCRIAFSHVETALASHAAGRTLSADRSALRHLACPARGMSSLSPRSSSASAATQCSSQASPAGVNTRRRVVRCSSLEPSRASSRDTARPMADLVAPSSAATAVKLPNRVTATNSAIPSKRVSICSCSSRCISEVDSTAADRLTMTSVGLERANLSNHRGPGPPAVDQTEG